MYTIQKNGMKIERGKMIMNIPLLFCSLFHRFLHIVNIKYATDKYVSVSGLFLGFLLLFFHIFATFDILIILIRVYVYIPFCPNWVFNCFRLPPILLPSPVNAELFMKTIQFEGHALPEGVFGTDLWRGLLILCSVLVKVWN